MSHHTHPAVPTAQTHQARGGRQVKHKSNRTGAVGGSLSALALMLVLFSLVSVAPTQASEACSNEARRVEQRATYLPECRAYEMASPSGIEPAPRTEANSGQRPSGFAASVGGDRIAFSSEQGQPAGPAAVPGLYFLSTRGSNGWSTQGLIPLQSTETEHFCNAYVAGYSPDLSREVLADGKGWTGYPHHQDDGGFNNCGHDEPLLVTGEPQGAQNLFLHESGAPSEAGFYQLVNLNEPEPARNAYFQAGSSDFSHVVFTDAARLTPEAPLPPQQTFEQFVGEDLYENFNGVVRLVTILPGGAPTWGVLANSWLSWKQPSSALFTNAVSSDGERVLFYGSGAFLNGREYVGGNLYMRENAAQPATEECAGPARACTIQIDAAQAGVPGPDGGGQFQWASADGSRLFFTDCGRLTEDSTAVSSERCGGYVDGNPAEPRHLPTGNDLYEYDLEKPVGQRLVDLTVDHSGTDALGADVQGLAGISQDGSYVYFVANGVLTEQQNGRGTKAIAGQPNLYLRHGGVTTYIATLEPFTNQIGDQNGDSCDWSSYTSPEHKLENEWPCMRARVSANGRFLLFDSKKRLTGYDNTVVATGEPAEEIYLYDSSSNELACASCHPDGSAPTGKGAITTRSGKVSEAEENSNMPLSRQLTDQGQVFFDTAESLLPTDENGTFDVYEYRGGHVYLISSGTSGEESSFREAGADGENVFFTTYQALVGSDTDNGLSLYDARVGGGFAPVPGVGPGGVVEAPACTSAEACKPPPGEPPVEPFGASSAFNGPGNLLVALGKQPPAVTRRSAAQLRAERLARALRACHRDRPRKTRQACERQARGRYGARAQHTTKKGAHR
jgi:hypothetical protein